MKKAVSSLFAIVLAVSFSQPVTAFAAESKEALYPQSSIAAQQIADYLIQTNPGTTSLQYAVLDGDNIVISGQAGSANKATGEAPTADTLYGIGSVSKMFVTTAVLQLADRGKVDLDAPLTDYIPEFTMKDSRYVNITPRMLLNHSSGLMGSTQHNLILFDDNDTYAHDHLLEELKNQRLKADPGAFSVYCNDGFTLGEILVERVSGMSFSDYVYQNISAKLGMRSTRTPTDTFDWNSLAKTYSDLYTGGATPADVLNMIGAGGIYSTAEDLCRFAGTFIGMNNLLSNQAAAAAASPEYKRGLWMQGDPDNVVSYGLGWDSVETFPFEDYGITALVKGGDSLLYHAGLVVLPEKKLAAAVLSSGSSSAVNQMMATQLLLSVLLEKGEISELLPQKSFGKPVQAQLPDSMKEYAGTYISAMQVIEISFDEKGTMKITSPLSSAIPAETYTYVGEGDFLDESGSVKLSFQTLANQKTYLALEGYASIPVLGQTASAALIAQKMEKNDISKETLQAWNARNNKIYLLINEKYSSQLYLNSGALQSILMLEKLPGYFINKQIIDADTAYAFGQIPMSYGRDMSDIRFFRQDGVEYLQSAGYLMVDSAAVPFALPNTSFNPVIGANGYAQWFRFTEEAAGLTLQVTVPDNASFTVYDADGVCINSSWVSKKESVLLPKGGYIVFAGDPATRFTASIS